MSFSHIEILISNAILLYTCQIVNCQKPLLSIIIENNIIDLSNNANYFYLHGNKYKRKGKKRIKMKQD